MPSSRRQSTRPDSNPAWHSPFLAMPPIITRNARTAFQDLDPEARDDAVQEVIANAMVTFVRLVESGRADLEYPTVLARYGIAQFRDGRRVGNRLSVWDVSSRYAQQRKRFALKRLDRNDSKRNEWKGILVEDGRAAPADVAAIRIDFGEWLGSLSSRLRRIAKTLATGETTGAAARKFRVSSARISQLRRELKASWELFQAGTASASVRQAACA